MAFTVLTLSQLQTNALALLRVKFPTRSTNGESFLGKLANALAGLIWSAHEKMQQIDYDATPQASSTYDALSTWATILGLADSQGGYGAKQATAAGGLTGVAHGVAGTIVWNGIGAAPTLVASDGVTFFVMTAAATIGGGGTITIAFDATTTGTGGNLTAGDVVTFVSSIAGVNATVTGVTAPTVTGLAKEALSDLLARILYRLQNPPKGGTAPDWRSWAEGVAATASMPVVTRAYVYPLRNGTGTVDVVLTRAGTGTGRAATALQVASVTTAIDAARLVCVEGRRVLVPIVTTTATVVMRVTPAAGYGFDWDSSGVARTVAAYDAGVPSLTFDVAPTAGFIADVNSGVLPRRIQVISATGAPVLPQQQYVTAYNAGTKVATLQAAFTVAPQVGDIIHAGGPVVEDVAQAVLDLVDVLGPSKLSGYAYDPDAWDDTLRVDGIISAAINARAGGVSTGAQLVVDFVTDPTINGAATNLQGADPLTTAPNLLVLKSVSVAP